MCVYIYICICDTVHEGDIMPKMPNVFASKMQIHRVINTTKANCVQLHVGLQGSRKARSCVKSKGSCLMLEALHKSIPIMMFSTVFKHPGTSLDIQNQSVWYIATHLSHLRGQLAGTIISGFEAESRDDNMMTLDPSKCAIAAIARGLDEKIQTLG